MTMTMMMMLLLLLLLLMMMMMLLLLLLSQVKRTICWPSTLNSRRRCESSCNIILRNNLLCNLTLLLLLFSHLPYECSS